MTSYRDTSRDQRRSRNNDWAAELKTFAPSTDTILRAARNRPEAVLVLAAGVALLLRGASKLTSSSDASSSYDRHIEGVNRSRSANRLSAIAREQGERLGEWSDSARDTANDAVRTVRDTSERMTGYASNMIDQISETASDYASTASHWADEAREGFSHQSQRVSDLARELPDDLDHAVREHPLVVAALGIAVGAAIGASLPSTRLESRAMGDARNSLFDAARQARGRVGEAAEEAYEEVKRAADERGLNVEGVTEVARDAAKTFAAGVAGQSMDDDKDNDKNQKAGAPQGGQKPQGSNPSPSSQSNAQSSSQSSGQVGSSSQARASSPQTSKF